MKKSRNLTVVWSDGSEIKLIAGDHEDLSIALAEQFDGYPFGESNLYDPIEIEGIWDHDIDDWADE